MLNWEDDPTDAQHIPFLPEDEQNPHTWEPVSVSVSVFDLFVTVTCILCVLIVYASLFSDRFWHVWHK